LKNSHYFWLQKEILKINNFDIDVLKEKIIDNTINLYSKNVLTLNETRSIIGYDKIDGGDSVLAPSNLVPIAELKRIADAESFKNKLLHEDIYEK